MCPLHLKSTHTKRQPRAGFATESARSQKSSSESNQARHPTADLELFLYVMTKQMMLRCHVESALVSVGWISLRPNAHKQKIIIAMFLLRNYDEGSSVPFCALKKARSKPAGFFTPVIFNL